MTSGDYHCDRCSRCTLDNEYTVFIEGRLQVVDALLCEYPLLLDKYYNMDVGKKGSNKKRVPESEQIPVPIGKVCWICKGQYFEDTGASILENANDDMDDYIDDDDIA